jgi:hypothetical protein
VNTPVLCYIDGQWAYFTTQALADQWGDDWNDAPYEHNAGTPNTWGNHNKEAGEAPWEIVKVAYDGPFLTPSEGHCNSPWSVDQINGGAVAWLRTETWVPKDQQVFIPAGTTLDEFIEKVKKGGGNVYLKEAK